MIGRCLQAKQSLCALLAVRDIFTRHLANQRLSAFGRVRLCHAAIEVQRVFIGVSINGNTYKDSLDFDRRMAKPYSSERWKSLVGEVTREDIPYCERRAKALLRLWATANHRSNLESATLYLDVYDFDRSTTIPVQHRLIGTIPMRSIGADAEHCALQ